MEHKKNESGRSMVEMMGYMAVLMVLTAGIGKMVTNAYSDYRMSKASLQLSDLAASITKAGAIDADYTETVKMINGEHEESLKNSEGRKLVPPSYRIVGSRLYHAFGGQVSIAVPPDDMTGGVADKFAITFSGLTRPQCIELAVKDWSQNKYADLYAVVVNNTYYWYWPVYTGDSIDNTLPVTRAKVSGVAVNDNGQCYKEKNNSIMWVFN